MRNIACVLSGGRWRRLLALVLSAILLTTLCACAADPANGGAPQDGASDHAGEDTPSDGGSQSDPDQISSPSGDDGQTEPDLSPGTRVDSIFDVYPDRILDVNGRELLFSAVLDGPENWEDTWWIDGHLDVTVTDVASGAVCGESGYEYRQEYSLHHNIRKISILDVNADGYEDIVIELGFGAQIGTEACLQYDPGTARFVNVEGYQEIPNGVPSKGRNEIIGVEPDGMTHYYMKYTIQDFKAVLIGILTQTASVIDGKNHYTEEKLIDGKLTVVKDDVKGTEILSSGEWPEDIFALDP